MVRTQSLSTFAPLVASVLPVFMTLCQVSFAQTFNPAPLGGDFYRRYHVERYRKQHYFELRR